MISGERKICPKGVLWTPRPPEYVYRVDFIRNTHKNLDLCETTQNIHFPAMLRRSTSTANLRPKISRISSKRRQCKKNHIIRSSDGRDMIKINFSTNPPFLRLRPSFSDDWQQLLGQSLYSKRSLWWVLCDGRGVSHFPPVWSDNGRKEGEKKRKKKIGRYIDERECVCTGEVSWESVRF